MGMMGLPGGGVKESGIGKEIPMNIARKTQFTYASLKKIPHPACPFNRG
jgi:hypothetical protein